MVALAALALLALPDQFRVVDPAADPAFRSPIVIWESDKPLSAILADLAKRTHRRIFLDDSARIGSLSIFVQHQPAAEVMKRLAAGFDLQWVQAGHTLFLVEQPIVRRMQDNFLSAEREGIRKELARKFELWQHGTIDPDELKARHQALAERQRAALARSSEQDFSRRAAFASEDWDLSEIERLPAALVAAMVTHMGASDRRRFLDGETLVGGTMAAPGIVDLHEIRDWMAEQYCQDAPDKFKAALVAIRCDRVAGQVRLLIQTEPTPNGTSARSDYVSFVPRESFESGERKNPFVARLLRQQDEGRRIPWPELSKIKLNEPQARTSQAPLEEFAKLTGCPVMAESAPGFGTMPGPFWGMNADEALNHMRGDAFAYVSVNGTWVVCRPRNFWKLPLGVDLAMMSEPFHGQDLASADKALDAVARAHEVLMGRTYGGLVKLPPWLESLGQFSPSFLALWQTLSPSQRSAALGSGIRASAMDARQRRLLAATKREEYMRRYGWSKTATQAAEILRDDRADDEMLWISALPFRDFYVALSNGSTVAGSDESVLRRVGSGDANGRAFEQSGWGFDVGFRAERPRFPSRDLRALHLVWQGTNAAALLRYNSPKATR